MIYKKKISVLLDEQAYTALEKILANNQCTISDAVNVALSTLGNEDRPIFPNSDSPLGNLRMIIKNTSWNTVEEWCIYRGIIKVRLYYLLRAVKAGHVICGTGNVKNKQRDAIDGRIFKTHTAWIAHCLKEDFGLNLSEI